MTLSTPALKITFSPETGRVTGLAGQGGRALLARDGGALWRLTLLGPDGAATVEPEDAAFAGLSGSGDAAALRWEWPDRALWVEVSARVRDGAIVWSLSAGLPDGFSVSRADVPLLGGLAAEGTKVAIPCGWGLEYDAATVAFDAAYPSCLAGMAFMAAYTDGHGVYLGAHDPAAHHKQLTARGEDGALALGVAHVASEAETQDGVYRLPYEMVTAGITDGYREASLIYRGFALTAPWSQAGPLSQRPIPQWLLDTELWLKPGETPWTDDDAECIAATQANLAFCHQAKEFFDVPIALHWYRWHQIPYDALYPEYFPPKAGFVDGVAQAQADGFRVMPYINGRLCDPETETWKGGGCGAAARDDDGNPYTEIYGSKVPLNAMCPSTPMWHETIASLVERIGAEFGVDGVYIDQIAAAYPVRCLDRRHPHSPGGGAFWVESYRRLLDGVRARLAPGEIITSEENAEPWIDQLDGLLVVNTPTDGSRVVPMYPLVYSGRAVMFGFQYVPPAESVQDLGFRIKMALAFLWGSQPGWVNAEKVMAPEARPGAELMRAMCRTRRFAHSWLVYGRLLGELVPGGENPVLRAEAPGSFGGTYTAESSAVRASAWLSEDGRLGVALANVDDAPHTVEVSLPLAEAGLAAGRPFTLETFGPEGQLGTEEASSATVCLTVPARGALFVAAKD